MFFPHDRYDSTGAFCFLPLGWKHRHGAKKSLKHNVQCTIFAQYCFFVKISNLRFFEHPFRVFYEYNEYKSEIENKDRK